MTISAIWAILIGYKEEVSLGIFIVIVLASLVQISPIKINPWDWFFGRIGRKLNKEVFDEVADVRKKLIQHIEDDEKEKLETKRRDILEFANSCMTGRMHTQEQFKFIIKKCDEYENYIETKKIKNGEITLAIAEIRRLYSKCLQKNSFLRPGEEFDQ